MQDHGMYERKEWIEKVNPIHLEERTIKFKFMLAKLLNLVFGVSMPHERKHDTIN